MVFVADGADVDPEGFTYGTFETEWPPRSGRRAEFREVEDARWIAAAEASALLVKGQRPALDALVTQLAAARENG